MIRMNWDKDLKVKNMVLEEKKIPRFPNFRYCPAAKIETWESRKVLFYFKFWHSCCNLRFRNDKNELRQKLNGQDMLLKEKNKISEVFQFSILGVGQSRECSFSSNFESICNLRCKNDNKLTEAKTLRWRYAFYQYKI